jgi:hypothetical membrane protein
MNNLARILAVWSAVLGYAIIIGVVVAAAMAWPGYDHLRQYISELGATGAPHGPQVTIWGFLIPGALLIGFSLFAFLALPRSAFSFFGFLLVAAFAAGFFFSGFFPCDFGCVTEGGSRSQMLHELFGLPGYLAAPVTLTLLAFASKRWEGAGLLFGLGIAGAVAAAVSLPLMAPEFEFHGASQRVMEGAMALWILACAAYLARKR